MTGDESLSLYALATQNLTSQRTSFWLVSVESPAVVVQAGEPRLRRIESLRALCALGVVLGHAFHETSWGSRATDGLAAGVYFFFVLSGYLIYKPFARHAFAGGPAIDVRRYYLNRALRLFPLYYAVVIVLLIVQEGGGSLTQWLRFLTWTQNESAETLASVDSPMWSVIGELQFYIVLPVAAWALARLSRGSAVAAVLALALLSLASAALPFSLEAEFRYTLPQVGYLFIAGMLLAIVDVTGAVRRVPAALREPRIWVLLAAATALVAIDRQVAVGSLMGVAGVLVVGACVLDVGSTRLLAPLEWRWLSLIGIASYSLYLWHEPLVAAAAGHGLATASPLLFVAVLLAISVAVSAISYRLLERPFLRRRARWFSRNEDEPSPALPLVGQRAA